MGSRQFEIPRSMLLVQPWEQSHWLFIRVWVLSRLADSYEYANYNSLQVNVTRRVVHNLTLLANVVYSKTFGDNNSSATEGNTGPPNPFNLASAYGPADFDQTIRFNASINYVLPTFR